MLIKSFQKVRLLVQQVNNAIANNWTSKKTWTWRLNRSRVHSEEWMRNGVGTGSIECQHKGGVWTARSGTADHSEICRLQEQLQKRSKLSMTYSRQVSYTCQEQSMLNLRGFSIDVTSWVEVKCLKIVYLIDRTKKDCESQEKSVFRIAAKAIIFAWWIG